MPGAFKQSLVGADWLAQNIGDSGLRIVDASWFLPDAGRSGAAEFEDGHIPGAVFWDIDAIADHDTGLPHMLPGALEFSSAMRGLGIGDGTRVVIYDTVGLMTAARPWWMLRYWGHDDVAVLDGGLVRWRAEGREMETGRAATPPFPGRFTPRPRPHLVRSLDELRSGDEVRAGQILDSRPRGRFTGTEPEPRPGCRSGHMPGAFNLPFDQLVDPETKCVLPPDRLRGMIAGAGIDLDRPVITCCGSGVTACVLSLGLHLIGHEEWAVYDGSWAEWGGRDDTPVER